MNPLRALRIAIFSVLACGCAPPSLTVQKPYEPVAGERFTYTIKPEVDVSAEALDIMDTRLKSRLGDRLQRASEPSGRRIEIAITNYYMRHGAARHLLGIMAGADNILSRVTVRGVGGDVVAEFVVESGNATAWGTSRGLIEDHVDKIVSYLQAAGGRTGGRASPDGKAPEANDSSDAAANPCREDRKRFCPDLMRGPGSNKCLRQHEQELSPACQARLRSLK